MPVDYKIWGTMQERVYCVEDHIQVYVHERQERIVDRRDKLDGLHCALGLSTEPLQRFLRRSCSLAHACGVARRTRFLGSAGHAAIATFTRIT